MSLGIRYTRNLFLRAVCVVYLFAFISFYVQIPGLYGDNGILPARSLLENSKHQTLSAKVHYQPTLLWLAPYLGLDIQYALDVLALLGSFLAFTGFVSQKFCAVPLFAGLWSLYFSLYQIGQVFVTPISDDFLLEAGFLSILVAPLLPGKRRVWKTSPSDNITFWLVKWLLFRFLLTSGLVKFLSGCPKWWNLSALSYHFESMVLPTPLAWYCHYLPTWFLQLTSVYANIAEIILPFLFFVPLRSVRVTGFVFQIFLQIFIVLTGNYNFTNLLIVTLTIALLDDQFFYGKRKGTDTKFSIVSTIANFLIHGAILYATVHYYSIKITGSQIDSKIAFTKDQFNNVVKQGLNITAYIGFISISVVILKSLYSAVTNASSTVTKFLSILSVVAYSALALILFYASTVPLDALHPATNSTIKMPRQAWFARLNKLHAVNQYGLFSKMGELDGRLEIILEGSNDLEGPWLEYNFLYKPGNVNHSLPFVAPYSPRLDWQMWFAAQNSYQKQPWILSLAHRLLLGRHEVLVLLDHSHSPFTQKAPKYIRASLYKYKYTPWNQRTRPTWWVREKISEYFPAFAKDSPTLVEYLKARNLLPSSLKTNVNPIWKESLDAIRYITAHLEATLLSWSVFTAGCAIITTTTKSK